MTAKELNKHFVKTFGFNPWPETFEVDAETYGNVCQAIFDDALEYQFPVLSDAFRLHIAVGRNNGIMFKNVELLLKK